MTVKVSTYFRRAASTIFLPVSTAPQRETGQNARLMERSSTLVVGSCPTEEKCLQRAEAETMTDLYLVCFFLSQVVFFYHPNHKYKPLCPNWADCTYVYCRLSHSHKLRRPRCKMGHMCEDENCRRLHPPTNAALEGSALWTVLTSTPYLIEGFLDFEDCRQLSLTCHRTNHSFSTNKARLTRDFSLRKKYLILPTINHYGLFNVRVPFEHVHMWAAARFSLVYVGTACNYFSFLFDIVAATDPKTLDGCFGPEPQPTSHEWVLVDNDDKHLVLEYPVGVDIRWQTPETLSALREIDVCCPAGVWYTCLIREIAKTGTITVEFPWWYSTFPESRVRTMSYPSAFIARARTYVPDWRSKLGVGSRLRCRIGEEVLHMRISDEGLGVYTAVNAFFVAVFPVSLEDTADRQFAPELSSYIMSDAQFNIPRLDMTDRTKRTRVTFHTATRYDLPDLLVF